MYNDDKELLGNINKDFVRTMEEYRGTIAQNSVIPLMLRMVGNLFDEHGIQLLTHFGYTPYFNDGERCYHIWDFNIDEFDPGSSCFIDFPEFEKDEDVVASGGLPNSKYSCGPSRDIYDGELIESIIQTFFGLDTDYWVVFFRNENGSVDYKIGSYESDY